MTLLGLRDGLFQRDNGQPYMSSRGAQEMAVSVIFTTLASCFVAARLYTRISLMKRMEKNDWMVVIALANSFIFMGLDIVEATSGMGMHIKLIPPNILERQMKAFWLTIPFYNAAVLCAKASILMQYLRVFPTHRMRVICWVMIAILAIYGTWAVISAFLNCVPVAKFWDDSIPGFCLSKPGLWFSNASMHITTDFAILMIPIPALMAIDLPRKQKIALMVMFALGSFVCITSIVRLTALKKIADSSDPTYDNVGAASWSAIECNTGIICACLPTLKPLLARLFPRMATSFNDSQPTYDSHRMSTRHISGQWHGDLSLGAPAEDPEYGAGDPERLLTLTPSSNYNYGRSSWYKDEKRRDTKMSIVHEQKDDGHSAASDSSSPPHK
ncbi:Integral membrane protein [Penicillium riverlandense]|uniref:Integral membrane protein n=1 Tax=Penicillium riverlandense TaxID=1903569 RepID=UPI002549A9BC|nr:Integral membrane protein [Penicillium riverlandense]KAJ5831919.1 Integral membrane protein [Penicillium riverlandense]